MKNEFTSWDMLAGKKKGDMCVLFVDMLGTKDVLKSMNQIDISKRHQQFINVLGNLNRNPKFRELRIHQVSDCAFVYSDDVSALLDFSTALFKMMLVGLGNSKYYGYLMRGGIGRGQVELADDGGWEVLCPGFHYCPMIGYGNLEAALLEKDGPRGARLFISKTVRSLITDNVLDLIRPVENQDYYEVNWMLADSITEGKNFLKEIQIRDDNSDGIFSDAPIEKCLQIHVEELNAKVELREISRSLEEMIKWAQSVENRA